MTRPSEAIWQVVMHNTVCLGEIAQPLADGSCVWRRSRVDLVEHERRLQHDALRAHQREHHARELAAGSDLAQRPAGRRVRAIRNRPRRAPNPAAAGPCARSDPAASSPR